MSHLIIEQGREVGKEVTVPPSGIKFGRSPANDLVLEDEVLMLFQGRFFFKSDGTLWVTDFSAGEKTCVGGEPIDERQLKVSDLVEIGSTAFRVISTRQEIEVGAAPDTRAGDSSEEIDLGFKPSRRPAKADSSSTGHAKHSSPMYRILQVAVVVLVLLVVVIGGTEIMRSKSKSNTGGIHMKGVFFDYECVRGSTNNIFRYSLHLTPQGVASLTVDDALNRHFTKSAQLSADAIASLAAKLKGSTFFNITGDHVGEVTDQYDLHDVALECDGEFNHVRVLNREMPPDMRQVVSMLEDFAFNALDVSRTLLKDNATLIQYAKDAYKLAQDRYRDRDMAYDNLAQCIKHLKEAINYLETLEPKPEPYEAAKKLLAQAQTAQSKRYKEYMFEVDKAMRVSDWDAARRNLRICAQLISDRSDDRYDTISKKTLQVEDKLRGEGR